MEGFRLTPMQAARIAGDASMMYDDVEDMVIQPNVYSGTVTVSYRDSSDRELRRITIDDDGDGDGD